MPDKTKPEGVKMTGILEGIKVVSMELMEAVPSASVWMTDWGADVIKVEPLTGDQYRGLIKAGGASSNVKLAGGLVSHIFQLANRNKKSLALDLKKESGRDIIYRLVKDADVFMTNYQLDAIKNLKMDYDTLNKINPRLIYGFLSGYGTTGPDKDERGYDQSAAWARSGMQYLLGEVGRPPPSQRGAVMDKTVAAHLVAGVLAALLHREKTGEGQELEVSLYHSAVWTLGMDIEFALVGMPWTKDDRTKAQNPLANKYCTKDGRWIQMVMYQSDPIWPGFCRAMEKPELQNDPRFSNLQARSANCEELIRILDKIFASKTIDEWDKRLRANNCIYARVQTPAEVVTDPQALANDFFVELHHPAGQMKVIASPVKFQQNPASVRTPSPELGQHNEDILLDMGYSWKDIARLKEQEVIL